MSTLGKRIKQLREERKLTQTELADKLGLQNSTLCQYELGTRTPNDTVKKAVADYFNVTLDYLMGRSDERRAVEIPQELKNLQLAFHDGLEDLTAEDIEDVRNFVEFLRSKKK